MGGPTKEEAFQCPKCAAVFPKRSALKGHLRRHSEERPYLCSVCAATYKRPSALAKHMKHHNKQFQCFECSKSFAIEYDLKIHMRRHAGEEPYKCAECPKTFNYKFNLKTHMMSHRKEKPYKCSECKSAYTHLSSLKIHMRVHTGAKPFRCSDCPATFRQLCNFKAHRRIHSGEKPFQCSVCSAAFAQSGNLKKHEMRHKEIGKKKKNKELFYCFDCTAVFTRADFLSKHQKVHTRESVRQCLTSFVDAFGPGDDCGPLSRPANDPPSCSAAFSTQFANASNPASADPLGLDDVLFSSQTDYPLSPTQDLLCFSGSPFSSFACDSPVSPIAPHAANDFGSTPARARADGPSTGQRRAEDVCCLGPSIESAGTVCPSHDSVLPAGLGGPFSPQGTPCSPSASATQLSGGRSWAEWATEEPSTTTGGGQASSSPFSTLQAGPCSGDTGDASTSMNPDGVGTSAIFAKPSAAKEKQYRCSQCPAAFILKGNLTAHTRIHTGQRPYKCSKCPAAFKQSGNLKAHFRIHTGERPYQCPECPSTFKMHCHLRKHKMIHKRDSESGSI